MISKQERRNKIKARIRGKVSGTAARPRMSVSSKGIEEGTKSEIAAKVGKAIAEKALAAGVTEVVFDRNGYLFHGRVKSLADAAREGGLKF